MFTSSLAYAHSSALPFAPDKSQPAPALLHFLSSLPKLAPPSPNFTCLSARPSSTSSLPITRPISPTQHLPTRPTRKRPHPSSPSTTSEPKYPRSMDSKPSRGSWTSSPPYQRNGRVLWAARSPSSLSELRVVSKTGPLCRSPVRFP